MNNLHKVGIITKEDLDLYTWYFNFFSGMLAKPDIIIYLHASPEVSRQRLIERDDTFAEKIPLWYLESLHEEYKAWYESEKNNYNFIRINSADNNPEQIWNIIKPHLERIIIE